MSSLTQEVWARRAGAQNRRFSIQDFVEGFRKSGHGYSWSSSLEIFRTRMVTEGFGESLLGQLQLRTGDSLVDCS
jgi:hypothetical protein